MKKRRKTRTLRRFSVQCGIYTKGGNQKKKMAACEVEKSGFSFENVSR